MNLTARSTAATRAQVVPLQHTRRTQSHCSQYPSGSHRADYPMTTGDEFVEQFQEWLRGSQLS